MATTGLKELEILLHNFFYALLRLLMHTFAKKNDTPLKTFSKILHHIMSLKLAFIIYKTCQFVTLAGNLI